MNVTQIKTAMGRLSVRAQEVVDSKALTMGEKKSSLEALTVELQGHETALAAVQKGNAMFGNAGSSTGSATAGQSFGSIGRKGMAPNARIDDDQARGFFAAIKSGQNFRTELKGVSDPGGLIPPLLLPGLVGQVHEPVRLLSHIPTSAMAGPSIEFVTHSSTTGVAAVTARGGAMPEVGVAMTSTILTARKISAWSSIPDELFKDYAGFVAYLQNEIVNVCIDAENAEILSGDGTGEHLFGLLPKAGLTVAQAAGDYPLDVVSKAITAIRVGSAKAAPDTIVFSPGDWDMIRTQKDTQGRYLVNPDPTAGEPDSLFGVPVLQTTGIADGTALVANLQIGAEAFVREGFTLESSNSADDDFTNGVVKFRATERLALGVTRPAALVKVTGLAAYVAA